MPAIVSAKPNEASGNFTTGYGQLANLHTGSSAQRQRKSICHRVLLWVLP